MEPDTEKVGKGVAVKLIPLTLAPFTVTDWLTGANVKPALLGVIVYVPFERLKKVKLPEASAVAVAFEGPLAVTVAPFPSEAEAIEPEIL